MCPSLGTASSYRLPDRQLQGQRPDRPRRRGLLGRAAPADDLGRHDHLDQRPGPQRVAGRQQHGRLPGPVQVDAARRCSWRGAATSPSRPTGTARVAAARTAPRWCRARPGTCGRSSSTASGNKNQDRSIQPSAIVGELPPFALAPPTPAPAQQPAAGESAPANPGPGNPNPPGRRHDGERAEPGRSRRDGAADIDPVDAAGGRVGHGAGRRGGAGDHGRSGAPRPSTGRRARARRR